MNVYALAIFFALTSAPAAPTPHPSCASPYRAARVVKAVSPAYPESARKLGLGPVTVLVAITINADGTLKAASIKKSSGNAAIDQAALTATRASTYAPKIVNCIATASSYVFSADFTRGSEFRLHRSRHFLHLRAG